MAGRQCNNGDALAMKQLLGNVNEGFHVFSPVWVRSDTMQKACVIMPMASGKCHTVSRLGGKTVRSPVSPSMIVGTTRKGGI